MLDFMLDFLKKNKKEKEAQADREAAMEAERQRKEEEKRKLDEQRAKIDEHAKGGKRIQRALNNIDLENIEMLAMKKENKISVEAIQKYEKVIKNIEAVLEDATISDVDTREIDEDIIQMVGLFGSSLEAGNEETATQILKGIAEGVKFTRTPFIYANEEQKNELARRRKKDINILLMIAECQDFMDREQSDIDKLDKDIEKLKANSEEVQKKEKEMRSYDPELPKMAVKYSMNMNEVPLTRDLQKYISVTNEAVDIDEDIMVSEGLKSGKEGDIKEIEKAVRAINQIAFGTPEFFGNVTMDKLEKLHEDFKEDLKEANKEMQRVKGFNKDVRTTMKTQLLHSVSDEEIMKVQKYMRNEKAKEKDEERRKKAVKDDQQRQREEDQARKQEENSERHREAHRDMIVQ